MSNPTAAQSHKSQDNQDKHPEWHYQWSRFVDDQSFLFFDWIWPRTLKDFKGKRVLDAGCGPGHHVRIVAQAAEHVTALDLNTTDLAREHLGNLANVDIVEADLALYKPSEQFDVVYSIGVIDHTDDPDKSFENLKVMTKPGGLTMVWVFSREGNWFMWGIVVPLRQRFLHNQKRTTIENISRILTALLYPIVHTIYRLPLPFLPFYEYFKNFRRLSFERNTLNTFDKLNSPQTQFITRQRMEKWFNPQDFDDIAISQYQGVSWRGSGRKRQR